MGERIVKHPLLPGLALSMRLNVASVRLAVPACTYACRDAGHQC